MNPVDPRAFEFVDELFGELLPHFTSRQMFAPMDEPQDLGKGRSKQLCDEKGFDRVYFEYVRDGGEDRREARARAALLGVPGPYPPGVVHSVRPIPGSAGSLIEDSAPPTSTRAVASCAVTAEKERPLLETRKATLTPDEARLLHVEALVIDSQQPSATSGLLFTESMKAALDGYVRDGLSRGQIRALLRDMALREVQSSAAARRQYMGLWHTAGVTVASATYAGPYPPDGAFEKSLNAIAQARAMIDALDGELQLVLTAADIERVYEDGKRGVIFDFQDATPFGSDLDRIDLFYNLGLRVVQLTYNLRNLVGDGCTERYKTGLTYFGREVVQRLNEKRMAVDVSHCSEQVGWDALEVSTAPIIVSHSASNAVCYHDRGKGDELAKAIADKGGFFGVAAIGGFLYEDTGATLDHFVDHVDHLVDVMGIDHVGIGSDKCGPGPGTDSNFLFPDELGPFDTSHMYKEDPDPRSMPDGFDWAGFRPEHRLSDRHRIAEFDQFTDWPNITARLAERGFNEEELRKLLGLNYLRVFRDVVG